MDKFSPLGLQWQFSDLDLPAQIVPGSQANELYVWLLWKSSRLKNIPLKEFKRQFMRYAENYKDPSFNWMDFTMAERELWKLLNMKETP